MSWFDQALTVFRRRNVAAGYSTDWLDDAQIDKLMAWRKPRRVFINPKYDTFGGGVTDNMLVRLYTVMSLTPQHHYFIATRHSERMQQMLGLKIMPSAIFSTLRFYCNDLDYLDKAMKRLDHWPLLNVWNGAIVEDQAAVDRRVPALVDTKTAGRFVLCDPMAGAIDLGDALEGPVAWVIIAGGVSARARPLRLEWVDELVGQCRSAGVACYIDRFGRLPMAGDSPVIFTDHLGANIDEWPDDFKIREFPPGLENDRWKIWP